MLLGMGTDSTALTSLHPRAVADPAAHVPPPAGRCFRCRQVADKVAGFPSDHPAVSFFSVDLEECEELGELLDVATLPTFVLLAGGTEVHRLAGVPQLRPARALAQAIRQHLLAAGPGGDGQAQARPLAAAGRAAAAAADAAGGCRNGGRALQADQPAAGHQL